VRKRSEQVTKETGLQWRYAELRYRQFHDKWPSTFTGLVEELKPARGLGLIFEASDHRGLALIRFQGEADALEFERAAKARFEGLVRKICRISHSLLL
jgi:hypothetical protein